MKKSLIVLVLALLLGAIAALLLFAGGRSSTSSRAVDPQSAQPTPTKSGRDGTTLLGSSDEDRPPARTQMNDAVGASARAAALLADATWVDVEVRLPRGTPADEKLELFAVVFAPDRFKDDAAVAGALAHYVELSEQGVDMLAGNGASTDAAEELACEPSGANRFRAPFPKGSKMGVLRLDARYAYLALPETVKLPSSAITLEPKLGAWLTGRVRLPSNLPSDIDPNALEPFEINLNGFEMLGTGDHYGAVVKLEHGLEFEFGGLPPKLPYFLQGTSPQFLAFADSQVTPKAGEHLERPYDLHLGAFVSGRIVDAQGAGLEGVELAAKAKRARSIFGGGGRARASSGADGAFAMRAIETGKVTVSASLEGYVTNTSHELELAEGQRVTNLVIALSRGNSLDGRVVWPDGTPARGAVVQAIEFARRQKNAGKSPERNVQLAATTDAEGRFKMSGMTAEAVNVRVRLELDAQTDGHAAGPWTAKRDDVPLGVELAIALEAPVVVRGIVVDDLGAPIAKFTIRDKTGGDHAWDTGSIQSFEDVGGKFELPLAVGKHTLVAAADAHGDSPDRELTLPGALDLLTFTLPRETSIQGVVLDPMGAPAASARVYFASGEGGRGAGDDESAGAKTDAQGRFDLKCTTPGSVTIAATKDGFAPSEPAIVQVIAGQPFVGVQLSLRIGGTLEGEIYAASGAPDEGREIMVGNFLNGEAMNGNATSDEAGHFVVEHLAPGKYSVMATPQLNQLADEQGEFDQTAIMSSLKMTTVEIVDRETTHIVLGAAPRAPVQLSGRVTRSGQPYTTGVVMAFADGKAMLETMKAGKLDGDGRYAIKLDAPGDYTIIVGRQMGDDQSTEFQETIPPRPEYELDFAIPLGAIRGRVTGRNGKPLGGIPIALESEGRFTLLATNMGRNNATEEDGRFAIENVKPGRYVLRANAAQMDFDGGGGKREWGIGVRTGLVVEADRVLDGVEIRLEPPGSIEGTVLGTDGKLVANASVFVRDGEGRLLNPISACITDEVGKFTFEGAPEGSCTVCARTDVAASRESAAVRVSDDHLATVELRLEPGTTLRVTIEDDAGKPVRASLRVVDEHGRDFGNMQGGDLTQLLFSEGFSSTEVRVGPLPSGKYKVTATGADGTTVTRPVTLSGQEARSVKIRLKE